MNSAVSLENILKYTSRSASFECVISEYYFLQKKTCWSCTCKLWDSLFGYPNPISTHCFTVFQSSYLHFVKCVCVCVYIYIYIYIYIVNFIDRFSNVKEFCAMVLCPCHDLDLPVSTHFFPDKEMRSLNSC